DVDRVVVRAAGAADEELARPGVHETVDGEDVSDRVDVAGLGRAGAGVADCVHVPVQSGDRGGAAGVVVFHAGPAGGHAAPGSSGGAGSRAREGNQVVAAVLGRPRVAIGRVDGRRSGAVDGGPRAE